MTDAVFSLRRALSLWVYEASIAKAAAGVLFHRFPGVRLADTFNSPFAATLFRRFHLAPYPVKLLNLVPIDRVAAGVVASREPFCALGGQ